MLSLRASLLDLPTLKHRLTTEPCANLIYDCKQFPQDPVMQIMASFWMLSEVVLDETPNQLHHQLYGRLGIYVDLYPEIADLLATVRQDNTGFHLMQPTLQPAYRGLHRLLRGHSKQVVGALVLSNNTILTWSWDETLRLWSADGELLTIMEGHTDFLEKAIELSTGRILSWSNNLHKQDETLRLWSLDGELLATMDGYEQLRSSDVIELPNGNILANYFDEKSLLWNKDGQLIKKIGVGYLHVMNDKLVTLPHLIADVYTIDGDYLGSDENIPISFFSNKLKLKDGRWVTCLEMTLFFHDGLESAHYQVELGEDESEYYIKSITQLKDGQLLVYCERFIKRREYASSLYLLTVDGQQLKHIEYPTHKIWHIEELHDGRLLILMTGMRLELWSAELEHIKTLDGHSRWIKDMIELDDGRLVTFSRDETIRLWSSGGDALGVIGGQPAGVLCAGILDNGRLVSYASGEFAQDKTVGIWNLATDETKRPSHPIVYPIHMMELRNEDLFACFWDTTIGIWASDGQLVWSSGSQVGTVSHSLELSNGQILAGGGRTGLWRLDGELVQLMDKIIWGTIQLESGRVITHGNDDIRFWTQDMVELHAIEEPENIISGLLKLRDERFLSWESSRENESYTVRIWSEEGEILKTMSDHTASIYSVMELSDGRLLSWSFDKTLRLWSADGEPSAVMIGHKQKIYEVFELADGRILSSFQTARETDENENLLWTSDGQFIRQVAEDRGYVISQGRDELYWDKTIILCWAFNKDS